MAGFLLLILEPILVLSTVEDAVSFIAVIVDIAAISFILRNYRY